MWRLRMQCDTMHLTPRLNAHGAQLRPLRYEIAQMMLKLVLMRNAFFTFIATVLKLVVTIFVEKCARAVQTDGK